MTTNNLTELWKKGELKQGWYYVLLFSNEEYITFIDGNWVVDDRLIGADIKEVLAPVPSYGEWKQMKAFCEGFNTLNVAEENTKLKELLKECRETIEDAWMYCGIATPDAEAILTKIDEVLK